MKRFAPAFLLASIVAACLNSASADEKASPLGFKMKSITGKDVDLNEYKGKVVVIVNVASKCGLTAAVQGPGSHVREVRRQRPRRARLPLQPVRRTGAGHRSPDRRVLLGDLQA